MTHVVFLAKKLGRLHCLKTGLKARVSQIITKTRTNLETHESPRDNGLYELLGRTDT